MRVKIFSPLNECHSHAASSSTSSLIFRFRPMGLPFAEDVRQALAVNIQTCLTWPSSLFSQPHFQGLSSLPPVSSTNQAEKRNPGNEAVFFPRGQGSKLDSLWLLKTDEGRWCWRVKPIYWRRRQAVLKMLQSLSLFRIIGCKLWAFKKSPNEA